MTSIGEALFQNDIERLDEIAREHGASVPILELLKICQEASSLVAYKLSHVRRKKLLSVAEEAFDPEWSGWWIWFKSRVQRRIQSGHCQDENQEHKTCRLHIWFLWLEESEEMLLNLRSGNSMKQAEAAVARSKISKTLLRTITPIDRVAYRVGPTEED